MADEQTDEPGEGGPEPNGAHDPESKLSKLDSGEQIGHDELIAGLGRELAAQQRVIGQLSDQREPEGINVAKVLDSSKVDLSLIMAVQITEPTSGIIGPLADTARRARIHHEINLPNLTAFQMCWRSVLIRIGRVLITGAGIFLGIAFFSSVRMTSIILAASGEAVDAQDTARAAWLVIMAFLVSVVGICNSMLMAVAERFQEIGTMKCLGALDRFIVKLFLIESGLLGLLSGILGSLLGMGIMFGMHQFRYQFSFGQVVGGMVVTFAWSMVLGVLLSILAAVLPAIQASKMPAAAALRTAV